MTVKISDVADRFLVMSGIDESERTNWLGLCLKCLRQLEGRLIKPIDNQQDNARLTDAAAVYTFYNYILLLNAREPKSFKAGDISNTKSDKSAEFAEKLWREAEKAISDLVEDSNFSFLGVPYRRGAI